MTFDVVFCQVPLIGKVWPGLLGRVLVLARPTGGWRLTAGQLPVNSLGPGSRATAQGTEQILAASGRAAPSCSWEGMLWAVAGGANTPGSRHKTTMLTSGRHSRRSCGVLRAGLMNTVNFPSSDGLSPSTPAFLTAHTFSAFRAVFSKRPTRQQRAEAQPRANPQGGKRAGRNVQCQVPRAGLTPGFQWPAEGGGQGPEAWGEAAPPPGGPHCCYSYHRIPAGTGSQGRHQLCLAGL